MPVPLGERERPSQTGGLPVPLWVTGRVIPRLCPSGLLVALSIVDGPPSLPARARVTQLRERACDIFLVPRKADPFNVFYGLQGFVAQTFPQMGGIWPSLSRRFAFE